MLQKVIIKNFGSPTISVVLLPFSSIADSFNYSFHSEFESEIDESVSGACLGYRRAPFGSRHRL
jgi:hypothetical protein